VTAARRAFALKGCLVSAAAVLAVLGFLFLSRGLWLPLIGRALVVADPLEPADAVVPLAGGDKRAVYAAELFQAGYADWFVATDMPLDLPGIRRSYAELVRQEAIFQGVPAERILVAPGLVETTYEEALAVRALAQAQGWQSLLIVTDPYHTRRARICFREAFRDADVAIVIRPIEGSWYDPETWWQSTAGLRETWTEYVKLALHLLGYR
jgi:uncharacterized SAM-binding protein YcdF (DUF218 family)